LPPTSHRPASRKPAFAFPEPIEEPSIKFRIFDSPWIAPVRRWVPPPNDRFVTYEPKDYGWLEALGYGHYEYTKPTYAVDMRKMLPFTV
jgi:hypothetical protein